MKETIKNYSIFGFFSLVGGAFAACMCNYIWMACTQNEEYANKRERYIHLVTQAELSTEQYRELIGIEYDLAKGIPRNRILPVHPIRIQ